MLCPFGGIFIILKCRPHTVSGTFQKLSVLPYSSVVQKKAGKKGKSKEEHDKDFHEVSLGIRH